MRKKAKLFSAFLAVVLLSLVFMASAYAAGEKTGTTTLTAIVPDPSGTTCTVSFDPNGGTGTMAPVTVNVGEKYTLPENGFTAPGGKAFDGWDKGQPGEQIDVTGDTVVTAQWKDAEAAPETCTVSFNAGGGTGSMAPVTVEKGTEYALPVNGFTAPSGKEFDRWDKGAVGTKINVNSDVTVTAQWKDKTVEPPGPGYDFKFTFTKTWQGDHEDSIDWVLYNPDGTVAHKKFNKKIVSENEWHYEAWFATGADYYIIETVPAGYKVRYENVGKYADITDRCCNGGTIINYKVPKTGDQADLRLWLGYVLLGVSAVCGALVCSRRKKENR